MFLTDPTCHEIFLPLDHWMNSSTSHLAELTAAGWIREDGSGRRGTERRIGIGLLSPEITRCQVQNRKFHKDQVLGALPSLP